VLFLACPQAAARDATVPRPCVTTWPWQVSGVRRARKAVKASLPAPWAG